MHVCFYYIMNGQIRLLPMAQYYIDDLTFENVCHEQKWDFQNVVKDGNYFYAFQDIFVLDMDTHKQNCKELGILVAYNIFE
jgi:hypothetical protein